MGTPIIINDTLKLTKEQGFPEHPEVGKRYHFKRGKQRLYNRAPTRVHLVEEVDGKWIQRGQALVWRLTIDVEHDETSGEFEIIKLYSEDYSRTITPIESPEGKSFY